MKMFRAILVASSVLALSAQAASAQASQVTCKDGAKSKGGRGACSSHGGVVTAAAKVPAKAHTKVEKTAAKADTKVEKTAAKAETKVEKTTAAADTKMANTEKKSPKARKHKAKA